MKLTPAQRRALQVLAEIAPDWRNPVPAGWFARRFWKDSKSWNRTSHQGVYGQFMPALGGRFLYRLAKLGLAYNTTTEHHQTLWYISGKGLEAIKEK